jgi:uncharacterized protein (DUF1778 family)
MAEDSTARTARIDLRMTPAAKSLLEQAAASRHKSVSEFMLDHALMAAEETLADRRLFLLNDEQWAEFNRLLDAPPEDNPGLQRLRSHKAPWDK